MKKLYSPKNESELVVIRSIFSGDGLRFFVHNDHFGTLKIGPVIELFNEKVIMVSENDFDRAKELLDDFLENIRETSVSLQSKYSLFDKIRMIIETLVFTWFVPGNRWKK